MDLKLAVRIRATISFFVPENIIDEFLRYDGSVIVNRSVETNTPVVYVSINYRYVSNNLDTPEANHLEDCQVRLLRIATFVDPDSALAIRQHWDGFLAKNRKLLVLAISDIEIVRILSHITDVIS